MYNRPCLIPVAYGSGKGEIRDEPAARVWLWKPETHRKRRQDEGRGDRGAAHMLDGAVVPHIIQFTYSAGGSTRRGSRYVGYRSRCPDVYERITVFYDPKHPADYAVRF